MEVGLILRISGDQVTLEAPAVPVISVPLSNTQHDGSLPSMPCADGPTYTLRHPPSMPTGGWTWREARFQIPAGDLGSQAPRLPRGQREEVELEGGGRRTQRPRRCHFQSQQTHNAHKASLGTAQALSHRQAGTLTALKPIRR